MNWETVIGLEVHVQLATKTKIFSAASTAFGAEPNTQACEIDLAMPGTLPVVNKQAIDYAVMFGLAIDAEIGKTSVLNARITFILTCLKAIKLLSWKNQLLVQGLLKYNSTTVIQNQFAFTMLTLKKMQENHCMR